MATSSKFYTVIGVLSFLFFSTFTGEVVAMQPIKAIHIGIVTNIAEADNDYVVTLDNGVVGAVPREHPIETSYMGKIKLSPYSKNGAVALLEYADGSFDWMPARLSVPLSGAVDLGKEILSIQDVPFAKFMEQAAMAQHVGNEESVHAYIFVAPVPSAYRFFASSPFVEHNYTVVSNSFRKGGFMAGEEFVNYNVDIAYKYTNNLGYVLYYVQKTRFTEEYCKKRGFLEE